jgi:hypothetical protein
VVLLDSILSGECDAEQPAAWRAWVENGVEQAGRLPVEARTLIEEVSERLEE